LPAGEKEWLEQQAAKNFTSLNAELIRDVRERKERDEQRA
jgi:hypothetical protein